MALIYKDGEPANTHPLNVVQVPEDFVAAVDEVARPPLYEVYMRMAEELAKRSTCARLQVGTVITNANLEHVVSIGYNGNARGFPNRCDSSEEGKCGCIHSEMNALVKSPGHLALLLTDMINQMLGYGTPAAYNLLESRPVYDLGLADDADFIKFLDHLPNEIQHVMSFL